MSRPSNIPLRAINYDHTLVLAIELSNKSWVKAAQVPGFPQTKAQRTIEGPVADCVGIGQRVFGRHEAIRSCGEVNGLIGRLFG